MPTMQWSDYAMIVFYSVAWPSALLGFAQNEPFLFHAAVLLLVVTLLIAAVKLAEFELKTRVRKLVK